MNMNMVINYEYGDTKHNIPFVNVQYHLHSSTPPLVPCLQEFKPRDYNYNYHSYSPLQVGSPN